MSAASRPESPASPLAGGEGTAPVRTEDRDHASPGSSGRRYVLLVLAVICAASFALYARWVISPYLAVDDFQILVRSWTWQRTWADLWVPANEHAMPLGRLTTWLLVQLAGRASAVPQVASLQGPFALVAGVLLLYLFVRRELGHPLYGLTAAALFGASTVYEQAVYWFSSSFSILTLDTLLLALLAAQRWRRAGRPVYLGLCALAVALAPTWFASGILAGPVCTLYLLPRLSDLPAGGKQMSARVRSGLVALVPLLGTGIFLAISLPRTAQAIMHLPHYDGKTALESFHLLPGLKYTFWSVVENLLLGQTGISSVNVPFGFAVAVWPLLFVLGVWWWRGVPAGRRLMLLGVGLIFAGYLLVYSARAEWTYAGNMNRPMWSRYHLLPQLGLALFVAAGLPRWAGCWGLRAGSALTRRQMGVLVFLIAVLWATQFPRTHWTKWAPTDDSQQQVLRDIDEVDAFCRVYRIGAATARAALRAEKGRKEIPGCAEREDGWEFLWGSPDPDPSITEEEARRLLGAAP
ncbi:MAG TPA: hypothetical protein VKA46_31435 [Gemmataceae bacterium]|nr:hypothetical protein [Gemmataceae bacterium]